MTMHSRLTGKSRAMKFYVGVTDNDWFDFLSKRKPDEVNFWKPGGGEFKILAPGELFLFKLHSPQNYIVGGGHFVTYSRVPTSLAWEDFGEKNGMGSFEDLLSKINKHRRKKGEIDPVIGCTILTEPFFFSQDNWIRVPENFHPNIVQGRTYDTGESIGARLWDDVQVRLKHVETGIEAEKKTGMVAEDRPTYGSEYMVRPRLGQGAFRILVTDAYNRRCAATGERTLPVLEAAHIKPHSRTGPNKVANGVLFRSDLHKLFDLGYLTITDDFNVEVSKRIKAEYENGREYYKLHGGKLINLPSKELERPSREFVAWHNQNIYKG